MISSLRRVNRAGTAIFGLALSGVFACGGSVASNGDDGTGGKKPSEPPKGEPPSMEDLNEACGGEVQLGPSEIKRLSRVEYLQTLRDLFPGVNLSRPEFIKDQATLGFENRARDLFATEQNVGNFNGTAMDVADKAVADLNWAPGCKDENEGCGTEFIEQFGRNAYRRPLTDQERTTYVDFYKKSRGEEISHKDTIRLLIEAMLQSPNFLYRPEFGGDEVEAGKLAVTGYEMANRLSYFIWGSMPDADLFDAAELGLDTRKAILEQAWRMLESGSAKPQLVDFYRQWLQYDHIQDVYASEGKKDPTLYPDYGDNLAAAMREEADRFTGRALFDGARTLDELMNSRTTEINGDLAKLYGVDAPDGDWGEVTLPEGERAGILTQGAFLASHAHKLSGSPPLRGNFVRLRFLCGEQLVPDPMADTSEPVASGQEPRTNRELFEIRLADGGGNCKACHTQFDPMGNTFENYDATGRHRTKDNGHDVDATGALVLESGEVDVKDAIELSAELAKADQTMSCMTGYWFEFAVGRNLSDDDQCKITALVNALKGADGDIRHLQYSIVGLPDFQQRLAQ